MTEPMSNVSLSKSSNLQQNKTEKTPINTTLEEAKLFDFDGNGKVDSDREIAAYKNYATARDEAKLEMKFDVNGDGQLDYAERQAFEAYKTAKEASKHWKKAGRDFVKSASDFFIKSGTQLNEGTKLCADIKQEQPIATKSLEPKKNESSLEPEPWINQPWL